MASEERILLTTESRESAGGGSVSPYDCRLLVAVLVIVLKAKIDSAQDRRTMEEPFDVSTSLVAVLRVRLFGLSYPSAEGRSTESDFPFLIL